MQTPMVGRHCREGTHVLSTWYIHTCHVHVHVCTYMYSCSAHSLFTSFSLLSAFLELMLEVDRRDELRNAAVTRFDLSRLYSTSEVYC